MTMSPSKPIEDYALIGDCETAALVGRDGSIDWLCWPRFDSDACFAALLGAPQHGRWIIEPVNGLQQTTRQYRGVTLILETHFETDSGAATLIDFMPPRGENSDIVRLVRGDRGRVRFRTELILRFDYGRIVPWVTRMEDATWCAVAGPDMVLLRTPVRLRGKDRTTVAEFDVAAGDVVPFVMTYGRSYQAPPKSVDPVDSLEKTESFWRDWVSRGEHGPPADDVARSLVVLKALTYAPTGGIVAAVTTSLPEQVGGERNWDYRYCWLRDATLTLLALMDAGYTDEARAWRDWLLRASAGSASQLQIMYGLAGERRLSEWTVEWLPGYEGSSPVRVGNAAHRQLQLDVYGELMDALYQARRGGIAANAAAWQFQLTLVSQLETVWTEPDHGLWEVRGQPRHFTYSKMMAWVAFDRAIKMVEQFGADGPVDRWREVRGRIHALVCERGYNAQLGSFVQSFDSELLDASLLLLPSTGFLPADDPRVRGTVDAIAAGLMTDGFVARYDSSRTDDGLPPGEGAFLACSFWLADAYVLLGRVDEASALFERLLAVRNDVGLLAEQYDTRARRQVGNFPQAFSHIALVNTAHNLSRIAKPVEQRAGAAPIRSDGTTAGDYSS